MQSLLCATLAWAVGGFFNGVAGFGGALVALPLVALGNSMHRAVGSSSLILLALSTQQAYCYRKAAKASGVGFVLAGCLLGVAGGAFLLRMGSESGLRLELGLLLIAYCLAGPWLSRKRTHALAESWGTLAGFLSTSLGTAYGINGPPLAVYMSLRGGGQAETKGGLGVFFIISGLFIVVGQAVAGVYNRTIFLLFAAELPATLLGAWLGIRISSHLPDKIFVRCLYGVLFLLGANLVRQGLA